MLPGDVHPSGVQLDEEEPVVAAQHVATVKKSQASIEGTWLLSNSFQVRPLCLGVGSRPWRRRMAHPLEGASQMPIVVSSPWIRPYPRSGSSSPAARRRTQDWLQLILTVAVTAVVATASLLAAPITVLAPSIRPVLVGAPVMNVRTNAGPGATGCRRRLDVKVDAV